MPGLRYNCESIMICIKDVRHPCCRALQVSAVAGTCACVIMHVARQSYIHVVFDAYMPQ